MYSVKIIKSSLLLTAAVVDCRKFIERDCLGLVFCALSSHDQWMRSAAYHIIERFIDHLDGSRFMEMDQIIYILNLLKDSLGKSRSKLASIVTIFLARAVKVMLKPGITVMTIYTLKVLGSGTGKSERTLQTQIRLVLEDQSDQGLHSLLFYLHFLDELLNYKTKLFLCLTITYTVSPLYKGTHYNSKFFLTTF